MKRRPWDFGLGAVSTVTIVTSVAVLSVTSACSASGDDTSGLTDDGSTHIVETPDSSTTPDASSDSSTSCETSDTCTPTPPLTCANADFCAVDAAIDSLWALTSIHGTSKDDVWAVGTNGTVVHYDGSSWTATSSGTTNTLLGVWATSPTDVWAVSAWNLVLHGTADASGVFGWSPLSLPIMPYGFMAGEVRTVIGSGNQVFVGGAEAMSGDSFTPCVLWSSKEDSGTISWGNAYSSWDIILPSLRSTWLSPSGALWGVGDQGLAAYASITSRDGSNPDLPDALIWKDVDTVVKVPLYGIGGSGDTDIWAVGALGTLRHWTGGPTWETVISPTTNTLNGIWAASPNDVWAVGDHGTILHFDGTAWTPGTAILPADDIALRAVWGSDPENIWVAGDGVILRLTAHGSRGQ